MRIKGFGQLREEPVGEIFRRPGQCMTDYHSELAIDAPMNEQAEALIAKPFEAIRLVEGAFLR